jgi:predicted nuclease with TOPRIM domain
MREICNAEWDDIQDRLKEKDAEITVLHETLGKLDIYVPRLEDQIREKDAEIERLKVEIFDQQEQRFWIEQRLWALLKRATDALEKYTSYPIGMAMSVSLRESGRSVLAELRKVADGND